MNSRAADRPFVDRLSFVVTMAMLTALSAMTVDICIPSQPLIAAAFGVRPEAGGLVVSAYLLGYGPGQLVWGPLSDRFGRMGPLMVGLAGFMAASIACAFSSSLAMLAVLRAAQGVFGGSGPVVARAIARDQGGGPRTARLLANMAVVFGAAPLLAPMIGSGLLWVADWRAQFSFLAVFALVLAVAARGFVGPSVRAAPAREASSRGHLANAARLFRERDFMIGAGALCAVFFGYSTLLGTGAAMAEARYGVTPEQFGPLFAVATFAVVIGPWVSRVVIRKRPMTAALRTGAVIVAAASVALLVMSSRHVPLVVLWAALFVYVLGFAMLIPMAHALALEPAGDAAGLASSLLGALPTLLAAGGAALASSSVFASAYQAICLTMFGAGIACLAIVFAGTRGRGRGAHGAASSSE